MAKYSTLNALFTAIANSLRGKTGGSGKIVADDFPAMIDGLDTGGITPTGTKTITTNGTHDVANYASAVVNVPTPEQITVVRTVTVSADVVGAKNHQMLSGDEFIKKHYADDGFSATLIAIAPVASEANVVHFNYQGNRNIGSSNVTRTGIGLRSTNASTVAIQALTTAINGKGYSQHMRVDSAGNLYQYLHTDYILKAGTYLIVLTCTT
jgi:hypothetical protein